MCRKTKLVNRLTECVTTNAQRGMNRPKLDHLDSVIAALKTDEENNLEYAERIIASYERTLHNETIIQDMQNQSKQIALEKKQKQEVFKAFKETPINCTGAEGTVVPYAVSAPTTQNALLYFGLSQTGKESMLNTHNLLRKLFTHFDKEALPLVLDDELSRRATRWAAYLVNQKDMKRDHSNSLDDKILGKLSYEIKENIFYQSTTSSVLTPQFVVSDWFSEISGAYKKYPETTKDIGHFLTVVSRSVDAVGVGMAKALNGLEYWVCQYRVRNPAAFKPAANALDVDWDCFPAENWDKVKKLWQSTENYKSVLDSQKEHWH